MSCLSPRRHVVCTQIAVAGPCKLPVVEVAQKKDVRPLGRFRFQYQAAKVIVVGS